MKKLIAALAAMFAASAFAQSTMATKTYVDRKYNEAISNSVQRDTVKIEIGSDAAAASNGGIAVGAGAKSAGLSAVAVGPNASSVGTYGVAVGLAATATNSSGIAVGPWAKAGSSGVAIGTGGQWNRTEAENDSIALGSAAKATNSMGIAIGSGAVAGAQSIAIGRDAKATHTAAVAIGPLAETTADNQMRIKYSPSEIMIGFWYPKSLQDYLDEAGGNIDMSSITNLVDARVANAPFLRSTDKCISGSFTQEVFNTTRSITGPMFKAKQCSASYTLTALGANRYMFNYGTNTMVMFKDNAVLTVGNAGKMSVYANGKVTVNDGADIHVANPSNVTFGTDNENLPDMIDNRTEEIVGSKGFATETRARSIANEEASGMTENLKQIVYSWENFLDGSNVVFEITNYVSGTYNLNAPKLRIKELRGGAYHEVYNSASEIRLHLADFETNKVNVAFSNLVDAVADAIAGKADRAWGKYTSAGGDAPSNVVYMTANNTVFAGGMEYERVAVGEGSICVLTTKGAPVWTVGDDGTFKFQDDGGTNYFGFAKTDSYVVGCNTDGITTQNSIVTLRYDVTMSGVPCIWYKESLSDSSPWVQLNMPDGTPIAGAPKSVTWDATPPAGQELCYINCTEPSGFFRATIEVAGDSKFMTNMKADFSGGVLCTDGQTVIYPHANGTWSTSK